MKKISIALFVLLVGCQNNHESGFEEKIPPFKPNSIIDKVWGPLKYATAEKDFSIAWLSAGGGGLVELSQSPCRVLCFSGNSWEKIEIRANIHEADTIYSSRKIDFASKDVFLKKECKEDEAEFLLQELIKLGLFHLPEEHEILTQCEKSKGESLSKFYDLDQVIFYIIKGKKVRTLAYSGVHYRMEDCPRMPEWEAINKIEDLFKNKW